MFDVSNTDKFFKLYNGLTPNTTDEEHEQAIEQYKRSRNYIRRYTNFAPVGATTSFIESINKNSYIMLNMAVVLSIYGFNVAVEMYVHKEREDYFKTLCNLIHCVLNIRAVVGVPTNDMY